METIVSILFIFALAYLSIMALNGLLGLVLRVPFLRWQQRNEIVRTYDQYPLLVTPTGRRSGWITSDLTERLAREGPFGVWYIWRHEKVDVLLTAPWNKTIYERWMNNRWQEICRLNAPMWELSYPHIPVRKPESWNASDLIAPKEPELFEKEP